MRKSNLLTFMFLSCVILFLLVFEPVFKEDTGEKNDANNELIYDKIISSDNTASGNSSEEIGMMETEDVTMPNHTASANSTASANGFIPYEEGMEVDMSVFENSLFIGDSRTVGLMEYAQIPGADFFCTVGMNVFLVQKEKVSVGNYGKVKLSALFEKHAYDKIFVMLGINELGYSVDSVIEKYEQLLDFILEKQPSATVVLQANLHVTKKRSDSDKIINNASINQLNDHLEKLAEDKQILYIDVNPMFDDAEGNLDGEKSADDAHLFAKYYEVWGKWIACQSGL